jgi:hypothetical protein
MNTLDLLGRRNFATFLAGSQLLAVLPALDHRLQLRPKIRHMKALLVNDRWLRMNRFPAVPLQ